MESGWALLPSRLSSATWRSPGNGVPASGRRSWPKPRRGCWTPLGWVPGSQVLDVGTGTGDTALLAAERVGPAGHVLAIDASPEMVQQAVGKVRKSGLDNVDVQVMDGARLSLADVSRDAVIGRNAMQFLPGWPLPLM